MRINFKQKLAKSQYWDTAQNKRTFFRISIAIEELVFYTI